MKIMPSKTLETKKSSTIKKTLESKKQIIKVPAKKKKIKVNYTQSADDYWDAIGFNRLPDVMLLDIFNYLGALNCYAFKTVCKRWHRIIKFEYKLPRWISRYIPPLYPPFKYQFDVIKWMKTQKHGGVLQLEPGMGKTFTSLTYMNISYSLRNLVICGKSQMSIWKNESAKFYGDNFKVLLCHSDYDGNIKDFTVETLSVYDLVVVTYHSVKHLIDKDIFWNNVFADEVHVIRNRPASIYPYIKRLKWSQFWGLTGSLIYNSIRDARNVQAVIDENSVYSWNNIKVLKFADVDVKLPSMKVHTISTLRTPEQDRIYQIYDTKAIDTLENLGAVDKNISAVWTIMHRMRQLSISLALLVKSHKRLGELQDTNTYKSPRIEHICESISKDDRQSIVFSYYVGTLDLIKQNLEERGISCHVVYSSDKVGVRDINIEEYIKGKYQVLLMSYAVGSHGYNLVNASKVYLAEVWWNMQVMQQAFKRAYRLGQQNHVDVYMYATQDSIESKMLDLSRQKQSIEDALVNECKPKSKLTIAEIKSLF
jgi:SNF2 family DNA or RNA helicase